MASFTTTKLIGASQTYTTIALWATDAPVDYTTAEKWSAGTFTGTFTHGETVTGTGLTAGKFLDSDGSSYVAFSIVTGNSATLTTLTGSSSGATCVVSSKTNTGCIWQGKINAASDNALAGGSITGGTTSSTAYAELTANTGASFIDNANVQTNALRLNASNGCLVTSSTFYGVTISVTQDYTRVSRLQIAETAANGICYTTTGSNSDVNQCILDTPGSTKYVATGPSFRNSLLISHDTAGGASDSGVLHSPSKAYNCTIIGFGTGPYLGGNYGVFTAKNCVLIGGRTTLKASNATCTTTTCYTDIASPPAGFTNTAYSTSTGVKFTNITAGSYDFKPTSGSSLLDVGTTDATNAATDIVGTGRPQGSAYDVGCWEYVRPPQRVMRLFAGFKIQFKSGILRIR